MDLLRFFANGAARRRTRAVYSLWWALLLVVGAASIVPAVQVPLDPKLVPQFVDPLPMPLRVPVSGTSPSSPLVLTMNEFQQKLLPASFYTPLAAPYNAGTYLWCYKADGYPQTFPGPTLEARVDLPASIRYVNNLVGPSGAPPFLQSLLTVDQTLHWADPLGAHPSNSPYVGPVPAVAHLHGGEVPSSFDGGPDAWWTPNGIYGPGYVTNTYTYPNEQEPSTLWYHDHALGVTRLNVYAGLAGFYLMRDAGTEVANLPGGPADRPQDQYGNLYEREVVIQDRMFDTNGQLYFPAVGLNPEHPFWVPEFFGNIIMVNGKTWPYLNVEPRRYRFRLLNGSNARTYAMQIVKSGKSAAGPALWQIASDGGYLDAPVKVTTLLMASGERSDVIVDFSAYAGQTLTLKNSAKSPFPKGAAPDPKTTGVIMQFRVGRTVTGGSDPSFNPATTTALRVQPIERPIVTPTTKVRALTLNENMGAAGPLEVFVNNTMWNMGPTENVQVGDTEVWEIINLTADTHPIHLHLVQYQIINRQAFSLSSYNKVYGMPMPGMGPPLDYDIRTAATGFKLGGNPDVTPFLQGPVKLPDPNERGWKDTIRMNPGEVTRVVVRMSPQNGFARAAAEDDTLAAGVNTFGFEPWTPMGQTDSFGYPGGPGYVWHCHIVDHEDNEMMRQFMVTGPTTVAARHRSSGKAAPVSEPRFTLASSNPSHGPASFRFSLNAESRVDLVVYDVKGRKVGTVASGIYPAGEHVLSWKRSSDTASGIYLASFRAAGFESTRRFLMLR